MEQDISLELPRYFRMSGFADDLSYNSQVYVRCPSCSFEERAFPPYLVMVKKETLLATPCPACNRAGRTLVRHREHLDARCLDCGHESRLEVLPGVPVRC